MPSHTMISCEFWTWKSMWTRAPRRHPADSVHHSHHRAPCLSGPCQEKIKWLSSLPRRASSTEHLIGTPTPHVLPRQTWQQLLGTLPLTRSSILCLCCALLPPIVMSALLCIFLTSLGGGPSTVMETKFSPRSSTRPKTRFSSRSGCFAFFGL